MPPAIPPQPSADSPVFAAAGDGGNGGVTTNRKEQLLVFALDDRRFALRLSAVERVVHATEISVLPRAPQIVLGVINVQGSIVPVIDVRCRFRLPGREMALTDQFVLARTVRRRVALVVDGALEVVVVDPSAIVPGSEIMAGLEYVAGIATLDGGLIFVHDLDTFLSLEEAGALDVALPQAGSK